MNYSLETTARLLITCDDRPGIVAAISSFFFSHGANITALDQYSTDPEDGQFFLRLEFQTPRLDVTGPALEKAFEDVVASRFEMEWTISYAANLKKMAILVSKASHALLEILWMWKRKKILTDITMVISNHPDLKEEVEFFGLPFHHVPVTKETKQESEQTIIDMLKGQADVVVLARYMQILTGTFVQQYPNRLINIHHSFLPAFIGADPYRQAHERGVKLIGATAHYVTEDLDAGPIIDQGVSRVSHRDHVKELRDLGRDLERQTLARAVRWHLEDRIIVHGNKTIVFV